MKNASVSIKLLVLNRSKEVRYQCVDKVIQTIESKNLDYKVGPSETTVDGNIDDLLNLVKELFDVIKEFDSTVYLTTNFLFNPISEIDPIEKKINKFIK